MGRLRVRTSCDDDRYTVTLTGELDIGSAAVLEDTLTEVCASGAREVLVDMAGIDFIDSSGMTALLSSQELCQKHGCQLFLTPARRPAQHAFQISGLQERLPFRESRGGASPS
jgi:anti-sigma B factor antagonist